MAQERSEHVPETPEALTADWLSEVLGVDVERAERQTLGEGQGFMGIVLRLSLESADPNAPASLIAKIPNKANRAMGELIGVYEREIMFYRTLADQVPIRLPRLHYADFDRDAGSEKQEAILRTLDRMPRLFSAAIGAFGARIAAAKKRRYVLLIEDLGHMQPADQLAGLDEAGCTQALKAIAPLHRFFWRNPLLQGHFWLLPLDVDARLRHGRFRQIHRRSPDRLGPALSTTLDWLSEHGETLTRRFAAEAPETLTHSDLRLDNVIFDGDSDCAFIDWQLVRRGPAAYDVAYFVSSALHESADAAAEERILRAYHAALAIPDYGYPAFRRDYDRAMLLHVANLSTADEVDFGNERGKGMMAAWMRRLTARACRIEPAGVLG